MDDTWFKSPEAKARIKSLAIDRDNLNWEATIPLIMAGYPSHTWKGFVDINKIPTPDMWMRWTYSGVDDQGPHTWTLLDYPLRAVAHCWNWACDLHYNSAQRKAVSNLGGHLGLLLNNNLILFLNLPHWFYM